MSATFTPVKIGRGAKIHAAPVGTKRPLCVSHAGHYSHVRGDATINCERCLDRMAAQQEFLQKRGLA